MALPREMVFTNISLQGFIPIGIIKIFIGSFKIKFQSLPFSLLTGHTKNNVFVNYYYVGNGKAFLIE